MSAQQSTQTAQSCLSATEMNAGKANEDATDNRQYRIYNLQYNKIEQKNI
jgi:hypothetical protein